MKAFLPGLTATAFERVVITSNTAVSLNSTTLAGSGSVLKFSVETNGLRMRDDGTLPTITTGVVYETGIIHTIEGFNGSSDMKFISDNAGGSTLNLTRYKYKGEG